LGISVGKNFSPSAALSKDLPFPHWSLKSTGEKTMPRRGFACHVFGRS
jgi:hypothetical protein